jgi:hypothetical protein
MIRWGRMRAAMLIASILLACEQRKAGPAGPGLVRPGDGSETVFAEDFESGALAAWQDGVDPTRHRIVDDPISARSGRHYLAVTYSAGRDGGWLTHFLAPGYDSLYVSYYVRFPSNWQGGTKLIAFYGSRTDNPWSAFGKAGACPTGADFFAAMLVTEPSANPGPLRFYTYYPEMAREPDGVTCWGRYGNGSEQYEPPRGLGGGWHHVEFLVQLNTPNQADARQTFWIDGAQQGSWSGFRFRDSAILRLNAVQLTFSITGGAGQTQELYLDDVVVRRARP